MTERGERSWWSRNWGWAVGGCCLGCLVIPVLLVALFGVGIFTFIRSAGPTDEALALVRANPEAVEALGEPLDTGWWIMGRVDVSGDSGEADLTVPVSGPRGEGKLRIEARRRDGEWEFERLDLDVEGRAGPPIDLLKRRDPGD